MVLNRWLEQTENPTWDLLMEALTEIESYDSDQNIKELPIMSETSSKCISIAV